MSRDMKQNNNKRKRKLNIAALILMFIEAALVIALCFLLGTAVIRKIKNKGVAAGDSGVVGTVDNSEGNNGPEADTISENTDTDGTQNLNGDGDSSEGSAPADLTEGSTATISKPEIVKWNYSVNVPQKTKNTVVLESLPVATDGSANYVEEGEIASSYAILVDLDTNEIIVDRDSDVVVSPASMTKIMTILVAADYIKDLKDVVTVSKESVEYCWEYDCSAVGFQIGEKVTVEDLLYGTILPSGADAALELAKYVAGSEEAFVALMNEKLEELGLSKTAHFTNVVGTFHVDHHCTMKDMAIILSVAIQNDLCKKVLSEHEYFTTKTKENPEGCDISNWFLRRIEDKDTNGLVVCGKTGFVDEAGCCAASYEVSNSGKNYICVTANTYSSWRCIYDHVELYSKFTK